MTHHKGTAKGVFFGLSMAFFYATLANFVKLASDVPNEALVFFRNVIGFLCVLPFVFSKHVSLKTDYFPSHAVRVVCALSAIYLYFFGIKRIALIDAIVLSNTIPLFVPLIILLWKKIKIPLPRFLGICVGFMGVFILLHPSLNQVNVGMFACLASAIFAAFSLIGLRKLTQIDRPRVIIFYAFMLMTLISLIPMLIAWEPFDPGLIIYLLVIGLCSMGYQFCATLTYRYLPATKGACFIYFSVLVGGVYEWIFWGSVPDLASWIGALLIIAGGIWALIERKPKQT